MAANAFRAKSVSFKSTALAGMTDVSINQSGSANDLRTDASVGVTAVFVDGIAADVTVSTTDLNGAGGANFVVGATGVLAVVAEKRAEGSGAALSGNVTYTADQATVISNSASGATDGIGSAQITFRCSIPTGDSSAIAITVAF
jgi:hypothetical protein